MRSAGWAGCVGRVGRIGLKRVGPRRAAWLLLTSFVLSVCTLVCVFAGTLAFPGLAHADGGVSFTTMMVASYDNGHYQDVLAGPDEPALSVTTEPPMQVMEARGEERPMGKGGLAYYAVLQFDKNVSYAREGVDEAFIEENLTRVHLRRADTGEEVPAEVRPGGTQEERQLIYVDTQDWLEPMTSYEVVVDEGIQAANGLDVTEQEYVIPFTTGDLCRNGLTVAQNLLMRVLPVIFVAGIAVAVIRRVRQR